MIANPPTSQIWKKIHCLLPSSVSTKLTFPNSFSQGFSLWTARPRYRRSTMESKRSGVVSKPDIESGTGETVPRESFSRPEGPQLNTQRSLKQTLQEVKLVQVSIYQGADLMDSLESSKWFISACCEQTSMWNWLYPDFELGAIYINVYALSQLVSQCSNL
jgi:hypothetical protein